MREHDEVAKIQRESQESCCSSPSTLSAPLLKNVAAGCATVPATLAALSVRYRIGDICSYLSVAIRMLSFSRPSLCAPSHKNSLPPSRALISLQTTVRPARHVSLPFARGSDLPACVMYAAWPCL